MAAEQQAEGLHKKSFGDFKVGDTIFSHTLFGWQFVAAIPEDVAQAWIVKHFRNSCIAKDGSTPSNGPMKEWEVGIGIIVGVPIAMFDEEKLNLLHKSAIGDVRLYLSRQTRKRVLKDSE